MREFEKEWAKQVEAQQRESYIDTATGSSFYKLYKAFKKDRPIRVMRRAREADQKRWWWER